MQNVDVLMIALKAVLAITWSSLPMILQATSELNGIQVCARYDVFVLNYLRFVCLAATRLVFACKCHLCLHVSAIFICM